MYKFHNINKLKAFLYNNLLIFLVFNKYKNSNYKLIIINGDGDGGLWIGDRDR
jgi:hypothetical protein